MRSTRAERPPARFRRRLTAAFVIAAAVSAGLLATVAFFLAREYRWHNFRQQASQEARVALALAPSDLTAAGFERLRQEYESRGETDILADGPGGTFTSSPDLTINDVPSALTVLSDADLGSIEATVNGRSFLVVGAAGRDDTRYWFFFDLDQVEASLDELARACAIAWVVTVVLAGAVGERVARRTLRPVAAAAAAAEEIAHLGRGTRLPTGSDEFGALARSFNRMADEVEARIAELERAADRERRFIADTAHDLRTPLTGLAASASLIADRSAELPVDLRRPASLLMADVQRLRRLVLELLELHRLDTRADPVTLQPLHARRALTTAAHSLGSTLSLELNIEGTEDVVVLADPLRLNRILANLLSNVAIHGGGRATVHLAQESDTGTIAIVDDGPGIPADELATIFDRFAKSDRSRASGGSGLGLAIARAHASAQGGELTAATEPTGGARFTLTLKTADAGREAARRITDVSADA